MHSNFQAYKFILTLSVVCAFVLSLTNSTLKTKQKYNVEVDRQKNVLKCAGLDVENLVTEEIVTFYKKLIKEKVITFDGDYVNISVNDLVIKENKTSGQLQYFNNDKEYLPIFEYSKNNSISKYIIPISGLGLWSTLYGYISLSNDFSTIMGITFYKHGETPGLGGEVDNPRFQKQFINKKIFNIDNELVSIKVVKGIASGKDLIHKVDGISGATMTCNGLTRFLKNDLNRYINFFKI